MVIVKSICYMYRRESRFSASSTVSKILKGTVSRDFSCPVYFIKHLLLVPIRMPRTEFKFFGIFVKLFVFVIDSPVMNTPGSLDSPVVNTPGRRLQTQITP
jgi:hypothetical protein